MNVSFRNSYSAKVWVAIMKFDPDACRDVGNWSTHGWWALDPGQQKLAIITNNRFCYYYAEAQDGTIWSGGYGKVYVYQNAFNSCLGIGSTAAKGIVGMRQIDTNNNNKTINLIR